MIIEARNRKRNNEHTVITKINLLFTEIVLNTFYALPHLSLHPLNAADPVIITILWRRTPRDTEIQ